MNRRIVGKVILACLSLLGIYLGIGWIKYFIHAGGEMADTVFFLIWLFASGYVVLMASWTYEVNERNARDIAALFQYGLLFLFSVVLPLYVLFIIH